MIMESVEVGNESDELCVWGGGQLGINWEIVRGGSLK